MSEAKTKKLGETIQATTQAKVMHPSAEVVEKCREAVKANANMNHFKKVYDKLRKEIHEELVEQGATEFSFQMLLGDRRKTIEAEVYAKEFEYVDVSAYAAKVSPEQLVASCSVTKEAANAHAGTIVTGQCVKKDKRAEAVHFKVKKG